MGTLIDQIEMVQRRSVRFIFNKYTRDESVTDMLKELKLCDLQTRRKNARLCLFYKINKGLTPMSVPALLRLKTTQRRTDNGQSYEHLASHSDPLFSSFYPRTIRDWNSLHTSLVSSPSLDAFSSALDNLHPII